MWSKLTLRAKLTIFVPIEDVVFRNQLLTDDTGNNF